MFRLLFRCDSNQNIVWSLRISQNIEQKLRLTNIYNILHYFITQVVLL